MAERLIPLDRATIFARVDGPSEAPPLLLFSGGRCTTAMWDPVMPGLLARFRVIRHDVRGSGRSQIDSGAELGLDRYAADAAAVLDAFGVERALVWAMAFGSRVAMAFAHRFPSRVSGLALYDASVERPDPAAQREGAARAAEQRRQLGIADAGRDPRWFSHLDDEAAGRSVSAAFTDPDHGRYVTDWGVPVLLATGDHDANLPATRRLHARLPGSQLVVLEAVGHGSVLQRPDLCLDTLLHFHDRIASGGQAAR